MQMDGTAGRLPLADWTGIQCTIANELIRFVRPLNHGDKPFRPYFFFFF